MTVTVAVNGLTLSHKGSGGYERNSAPDVCKSPGAPIPYQIISFNRDLVRGSETVAADGGHTIDILGSAHSRCFGDEPGRGKGVISQTVGDESTWITHSPDVFIEGRPVERLSDKMFMNNRNTISGTGGNWEPTLQTSDEMLYALCKVFCQINNDGQADKDTRARQRMETDKDFKDAVRKKRGAKAASSFGGSIFHPTKKDIASPKGRPRKNWANHLDELQKKLRDTFFRNARRIAGRKGLKKLGTLWTRAIPGVGWAMLAYDVYDTAKTATDLWKTFRDSGAIDRLRDKAAKGFRIFEARPDVLVQSEGKATDIYDFKFGRDDWQPGQKDLYDDILKDSKAGRKAVAVDEETCQCRRKNGLVG